MENPKQYLRELVDAQHDAGTMTDQDYEQILEAVESIPELGQVDEQLAAEHGHRTKPITDPAKRSNFNWCTRCADWFPPLA